MNGMGEPALFLEEADALKFRVYPSAVKPGNNSIVIEVGEATVYLHVGTVENFDRLIARLQKAADTMRPAAPAATKDTEAVDDAG